MLWLLLPLLILGAAFGAGRKPSPTPVPFREREDETDLVEQLARYGTDDDARRLLDDGYGDDLAGLGYHPQGD